MAFARLYLDALRRPRRRPRRAPSLADRLRRAGRPPGAAAGAARHQRARQLRPAAGPARGDQRRRLRGPGGAGAPATRPRGDRRRARLAGRRRGRRAGRVGGRSLLDRVLQPLNRLSSNGSCARPARRSGTTPASSRSPGWPARRRTPSASASSRCSAPPGSPTCSPPARCSSVSPSPASGSSCLPRPDPPVPDSPLTKSTSLRLHRYQTSGTIEMPVESDVREVRRGGAAEGGGGGVGGAGGVGPGDGHGVARDVGGEGATQLGLGGHRMPPSEVTVSPAAEPGARRLRSRRPLRPASAPVPIETPRNASYPISPSRGVFRQHLVGHPEHPRMGSRSRDVRRPLDAATFMPTTSPP